MTYEPCPICGYAEMPYPAVPENICPCCGTEFGVDDDYHSPLELRSTWIENDFPFFSDLTQPPKNWSPHRQLIIAGYGADLTSHARFRRDFEYRYAVNTAFSEVRIGKQLKVLRETRRTPLTQAQVADKADMKQSRISELEGMNYSSWSISTIERLAKAMGVGIKYSFAGWGELVAEMEGGLSREELYVPSFDDDPMFKDEPAEPAEPERVLAEIVAKLESERERSKVVSIGDFRDRLQRAEGDRGYNRPQNLLTTAATGR
jgi:transcriptional regulator with XRE-family HTH domain